MKRSGIAAATCAVSALALVVGLFLTAPTRAHTVQEAKQRAASSTGTWVYEGQQSFANPHDDTGVFTETCNLISRPGSSEKLVFRSDPILEAMPKGTAFKLVFQKPPSESQGWDDYLQVKPAS